MAAGTNMTAAAVLAFVALSAFVPASAQAARPQVQVAAKAEVSATGTAVTISGFMARAGGTVGNAFQVRLPDGRDLFNAAPADAPK